MKKIMIVAAMIIGIISQGCSNEVTDNQNQYSENSMNYQESITEESLYKLAYEDLSDAERESLIFMREEEKLARDVYKTFYEKYNMPIFQNISNSEQAHTNAIKYLLNKYSIPDPIVKDVRGVFTNPELQTLYNSLIEQGSVSDIEALKVGALIEEVDILDIQSGLQIIDNNDIIFVYNNLRKGSINHLKAFVRNLSFRGYNYVPVKLSIEEYNSIMNQ